jgi:YHS domain-containing protein
MRSTLLALLLALTTTAVLFGQTTKVAANSNIENKLALQGYDPVAYFNQNKAIEGASNIKTEVNGIIYYFSSESNKKLFITNPEKYQAEYGGWCAYAMGDSGEKVAVNPETFKILNGKLYLFYNAYFTNTLPKWNKNEAVLKKKADENWANIIK